MAGVASRRIGKCGDSLRVYVSGSMRPWAAEYLSSLLVEDISRGTFVRCSTFGAGVAVWAPAVHVGRFGGICRPETPFGARTGLV